MATQHEIVATVYNWSNFLAASSALAWQVYWMKKAERGSVHVSSDFMLRSRSCSFFKCSYGGKSSGFSFQPLPFGVLSTTVVAMEHSCLL